MALAEVVSQEKKSSDIQKPLEKKEKLSAKVVVRRLPPHMDRETFLNQISPVPSYDYMYMVKGDLSLGENAFSRAYINFTNPTDIYDFKEKFDNYVFLDNTGHEYPAVVEFAAFQKIPKKRNKMRVDPKSGTIETDPIYLEFVEMINKPVEQDEKPEYSLQLNTENKNDETTPLLEYVKNKRAERMRIREERREERKRREFERKKYKDDDRKRTYEEKSPVKSASKSFQKVVNFNKEKHLETDPDKAEKEHVDKVEATEDKPEKYEKSSYYKNREKNKYDDRKKDMRPKYPPKKDYLEKREYKSRRDDYKDYRPKFDEYKRDADIKVGQKKVKKYSERREERKIEAQKAEQKKLEQQTKDQEIKIDAEVKPSSSKIVSSMRDDKIRDESNRKNASGETHERDTKEKTTKVKEGENQSQRRIRNKDRPTIAIYRPGMLSKRKQTDGDSENKDTKKE